MHELHVMAQVVKAVDLALQQIDGAKPSVVRLKVSALSHLMSHDVPSLQTTFDLASRGTTAEGATLEILTVPVGASCRSCGKCSEVDQIDANCVACGSSDLELAAVPDVVVHEVVVMA